MYLIVLRSKLKLRRHPRLAFDVRQHLLRLHAYSRLYLLLDVRIVVCTIPGSYQMYLHQGLMVLRANSKDFSRVICGYPSVHGAVSSDWKSYGPVLSLIHI